MFIRKVDRFYRKQDGTVAAYDYYHLTKSYRDAVNNRLGKFDQKYGAIRKNYTVELTYEGTGKKEIATAMAWKRNDEKTGEVQKFHGKYVLLTSLDESDEVNIWKFYNVIRTVEETFHVLKTDLDIRPVYHKSDGGIKAHLNLAVLAYWLVSLTKHRLKIKGYENVRWDEIMRIVSTQVIVTAQMKTTDGDTVKGTPKHRSGRQTLCHLLPIGYKSASAWKGKICGAQKITSKKSTS